MENKIKTNPTLWAVLVFSAIFLMSAGLYHIAEFIWPKTIISPVAITADYASETAYRCTEKKLHVKFIYGEIFPDIDYPQIIEVKRDSANCEKRTAAAEKYYR